MKSTSMFGQSFVLLMCLKPISDRRFKYSNVNVFQSLEFITIACHTRLTYLFAVCFGQVCFIVESKNVYRDACCVGTQANLIKLSGLAVGIFYGVRSITDVWIGNSLALGVFTIKEPEFTFWFDLQDRAVKVQHVTALGFRLAGDVVFDLTFCTHMRYC